MADFLILRLYLATPFQVPDDTFERIVSFLITGLKCFEILRVFGKRLSDRFVDKIGNAAVRLSCLHSKRPVQ